jgi:hypothetical protein
VVVLNWKVFYTSSFKLQVPTCRDPVNYNDIKRRRQCRTASIYAACTWLAKLKSCHQLPLSLTSIELPRQAPSGGTRGERVLVGGDARRT